MSLLSHSDVISLLLALSFMLAAALLMGELFRRFKQPSVVGEILAGIILGPTILGTFFPEFSQLLFPATGSSAIAREGIVTISAIMLLFIAGLEVEFQIVWAQGRSSLVTSLLGILFPFSLGFLVAWYFPHFFGIADPSQTLVFALFLGTALCITALPVIARILMDLNLFKSKIGMLLVASAIINDLIGWLIFSVVLSMLGESDGKMSLTATIGLTLAFTLLTLSLGRNLIDKALPWVKKKFAWPGGLLALALSLCFLASAFTEWIGIHSIFGAFIIGVAFGDSRHLSERAREIIHQFVSNVFAPLFFVSIGLQVNFAANFDIVVILILLVLGYIGKVIGSGFGAYWTGFKKNDAIAIGFGMNTHGAMDIILGLVALQAGLIADSVFVALVFIALFTSMTGGQLVKYWMNKDSSPKVA